MDGGVNCWRGNEDISAKPASHLFGQRVGLRNHKSVAVSMHREPANQHVLPGSSLRNCEAIGVDGKQLSSLNQFLQAFGEFPSSVAVQAQLTNQLFETGRVFRLSVDVPQNGGVG